MEKKKKSTSLKKKLEKCEKEREEYLQGWQRERANFLNYKKEEGERVKIRVSYIKEDLVFTILPILDNFEAAEKNTPEELKNNNYFQGFLQIKIQLLDFLKNQEVEEIKALGEKFDINFHEVVEEVEGEESGIIVEEVLKGYIMGDKLLRPSKVKIIK